MESKPDRPTISSPAPGQWKARAVFYRDGAPVGTVTTVVKTWAMAVETVRRWYSWGQVGRPK